MMVRGSRKSWRWAIPACLAFALAGLVIWIASLREVEPYAVRETLQNRTMLVLVVLWTFGFGASVGSFLNVVVYRWPRRESVVARGSHCPYCQTAIRIWDNIPVLSWLWLGGRCRACRLPISPRYVLVELAVGALFSGLLTMELFALPAADFTDLTGIWQGIAWVFIPTTPAAGRARLLHAGVLVVLLSWGLIKRDRQRIPPTYALAAIVGSLVTTYAYPDLLPTIGSFPGTLQPLRLPISVRLDAAAAGVSVGASLGALIGEARRVGGGQASSEPPRDAWTRYWENAIATGLIGAALGWQAVLLAVALAVVIGTVWGAARRNRELPPLSWIAPLALGTLLAITLVRVAPSAWRLPLLWVHAGWMMPTAAAMLCALESFASANRPRVPALGAAPGPAPAGDTGAVEVRDDAPTRETPDAPGDPASEDDAPEGATRVPGKAGSPAAPSFNPSPPPPPSYSE